MKLRDDTDGPLKDANGKHDATPDADRARKDIGARPISFVPRHLLLDFARRTRAARDSHARHFPKDVFRDTAWDIMLELFIASEESRNLCVKEAMLVAGESPAGAARRLDSLENAGLIRRGLDPADHRRVLLHLSQHGRKAMFSFLCEMFQLPPER